MSKDEIIISAAGSGKTQYIVDQALNKNGKILITTFTEANEAELITRIINKAGCIPQNICIQTWFSFLIKHGVKPFKAKIYPHKVRGMVLVNQQSGIKYRMKNGIPVYYKESEIEKHYFSNDGKIYSDKIAKFTLLCNYETNGYVIDRLSKIYSHIFIDEAQDLASYDLDLLRLLFISPINLLLVCDPRQTIYQTHHATKNKKYSEGKITDFIIEKCNDLAIDIDESSLGVSHRNNEAICSLSSKLYPEYPISKPCNCVKGKCRLSNPHEGIFLVRKNDINHYLEEYNPMQLRLNKNTKLINKSFSYMNFGISKGKSFDRVLIFPTKEMCDWLLDNNKSLKYRTRAHFYVAITRAKYSVGIVYDFPENTDIEGIKKYEPRFSS